MTLPSVPKPSPTNIILPTLPPPPTILLHNLILSITVVDVHLELLVEGTADRVGRVVVAIATGVVALLQKRVDLSDEGRFEGGGDAGVSGGGER